MGKTEQHFFGYRDTCNPYLFCISLPMAARPEMRAAMEKAGCFQATHGWRKPQGAWEIVQPWGHKSWPTTVTTYEYLAYHYGELICAHRALTESLPLTNYKNATWHENPPPPIHWPLMVTSPDELAEMVIHLYMQHKAEEAQR